MKVVFLNSSFVSQPRDRIQRWDPQPRLGIAGMAAYLRSKGHDVHLLDPQAERIDADEAANRIAALSPDFLALPAHTEEINDAAEIARLVKSANSNIKTVIGGYHVSALPEETLTEYPVFDFGVISEGELPLEELVSGMPPEKIAGLVYRDNGAVRFNAPRRDFPSLDDLPPPAWDLYPLSKYTGLLPIEAVRSCPFSCIFCFKSTAPKLRYKSPERVVAEIEKYAGAAWRFLLGSSGTFPVDRRHAVEFCETLIKRGLNVKWCTYSRVDLLDEELLLLMKKSGCFYMNVGIETGDPDLLSRCSKGFTPDMAENVVKLCHKVGMGTEINFILGLPYETRQSLENTRQLARRLRPYSTLANFAILTPFPGTKVYEMALQHEGGIKLKTRDWRLYTKQEGQALEHDAFTEKELRNYQTKMYLSYYLGSPVKFWQFIHSDLGHEVLNWRRAFALIKRIVTRS